jgi:hypothetical protein
VVKIDHILLGARRSCGQFLWFWKSLERGEIFFGGVGAPVEFCQIFDVLDFTYVGLHTSTDAKDIFLELHLHT